MEKSDLYVHLFEDHLSPFQRLEVCRVAAVADEDKIILDHDLLTLLALNLKRDGFDL